EALLVTGCVVPAGDEVQGDQPVAVVEMSAPLRLPLPVDPVEEQTGRLALGSNAPSDLAAAGTSDLPYEPSDAEISEFGAGTDAGEGATRPGERGSDSGSGEVETGDSGAHDRGQGHGHGQVAQGSLGDVAQAEDGDLRDRILREFLRLQ